MFSHPQVCSSGDSEDEANGYLAAGVVISRPLVKQGNRMAVVQQSTNGLLSSHGDGQSEAFPGIGQAPASNNYAFLLHGRLVGLVAPSVLC